VQRSRGSRSNNNEYIWRKTRNRTLNQDEATLATGREMRKELSERKKKNIQK